MFGSRLSVAQTKSTQAHITLGGLFSQLLSCAKLPRTSSSPFASVDQTARRQQKKRRSKKQKRSASRLMKATATRNRIAQVP